MTSPTEMDRKDVEALLVFLANDTLEGDERRAVEAAVAADPVLQTELEALKRIRAEMQAEDLAHSPGEFGLARLMRDIDREQPEQIASATIMRPRIWQTVAAAAVALLVAQSIWTWNGSDDTIRLAGEGTGELTIKVAFSGQASEAELRALLQELDLTIVSGPSALGLYVLEAPDKAARDGAIDRLNSETTLVESAEAEEE